MGEGYKKKEVEILEDLLSRFRKEKYKETKLTSALVAEKNAQENAEFESFKYQKLVLIEHSNGFF